MTQDETRNASTLAGSSAGLGPQPSGPSGHSTSGLQLPTPTAFGSSDGNTTHLRTFLKCTIKSHQEGSLTKYQATAAAMNEINEWKSEGVDDERREAAFEAFRALLAVSGSRSLSPIVDTPNVRKTALGSGHGSFGGKVAGKRKRYEERHEIDDQLDQEDEIDEEDNLSIPRRRLRIEDVPWHTATSPTRRPSCAKTSKILVTLGLDLPRARLLLRNAENLPQGIPSSQWDRVLRGESLDFNHLIASRFGLNMDTERKGRLGEVEVVFSVAKVKERVKSALDWLSAFQQAKKATLFVFKHQEDEFNTYEDRIRRLFEAKHPDFHHRVILFDKAIRNIVRGGQNILLTDCDRFEDLTESILHADGTKYLADHLSQRQDSDSDEETRLSESSEDN